MTRMSPGALRRMAAAAVLAACGAAALPAAAAVTTAVKAASPAGNSCTVNGTAYPVCSGAGSGWAFEGGSYCVARSFCPANRTALPTAAGRATPVNAKATPKTQAVYSYLRSVAGKKIIAGQMDLTWEDDTDMAERVRADTGKYPALMGYDFMNYGMSSGDGHRQTEEAIAWANKGGLVTFCWHWRDPSLLKTPRANAARFYVSDPDAAKNTAFSIPMADGGLDKNSPAYQQINDGIDLIAVELKKLQDAGVPVLWRPLHEASGNNGEGWFWWGRTRTDGAPQAYANILLWRHMYDRLVNQHGLHNLIWVWSGQDAAWYPGDDVVDVMGYDVYDQADEKTYRSQIGFYRQLQKMSVEKKLVAMTENSYIPDPDKMARDAAWWSWFMVWNDGKGEAGVSNDKNFWTGEHFNTNEHKKKVYNHGSVITLDKLPRF